MATNLNLPTHPRKIGESIKTTMDARDLHARLGVGRDFTNWIKDRITQYGFEEGTDYCSPNSASRENQSLGERYGNLLAGRNRKDYFITTDMAKELALVENNPQGRAIRKALIRMEERLMEEIPALMATLHKELRLARPDWHSIERYIDMGLTHSEIGKLLGISSSSVRDKLKRMTACKLVNYTPDPRMVAQARKARAAQLSKQAAQEGTHHG